ncbi:MAG: phosphatase PAP2 family protein [Solirubrobacterales bacterium]
MSTTEFAQVGAEQASGVTGEGFARWPLVRKVALGLYFVALVLWSAQNGIPVQRELVVLWTLGALVCVSLGRPPRQVLQLVVDWAPMMIILAAYDFTRGAADNLGIGTHYHPMIDFDKAVFFGETPSEWLQAHLYDPQALSAWNVLFTLVYTSYFIVPFALAGYLWARDRLAFLRWIKRMVSLGLAGLSTYILFPAAPPWLAAEMGMLHGVDRTTSKGWEILGVGTAGLFEDSQEKVNLVAAVPSLHSGFCMLVALFIWPRVKRRALRPLVLLYPLVMGITLMATGEHYFFDVALGWCYAGAVMAAWGAWERLRGREPMRAPDTA